MTVTQRQHLLAYLGYYVGKADGIWGTLSKTACAAFQKDRELASDGSGNSETDKALKQAVANDLFKSEPVEETETGGFWDHIRYWKREEFRCKCGGKYCNGFPAEPDQTLVELVDDIREKAGAPGHRSSGIRCTVHNQRSGGVANSKHLQGKALDFYIEGLSGAQLLQMAQADPRTSYAYQIRDSKTGNLTDYVHVDVK